MITYPPENDICEFPFFVRAPPVRMLYADETLSLLLDSHRSNAPSLQAKRINA